MPDDLQPVLEVVAPLRAALNTRRRSVLVAPPGAGKTTVVPLELLNAALAGDPDMEWLGKKRIVMLEPRRLAARAAARRMAATTGTSVGDLVGYQTRDERRISATTRIEVLTEGILTRRMQMDPELPGVGLVIFDEVHERNLPTDLGLALALDSAATIRPDLRILAMSATPDTDKLAELLSTEDAPAPIIESEGRAYPVDVRWTTPKKVPRTQRGNRIADRVAEQTVAAVLRALKDEPIGDILVFLPGIGEIRRVESQLASTLGSASTGPLAVDVYPLAGALSVEDQDLALAPSPMGRRRVVLSTDIAETSLTVAGVRIVIDAGLAREPRFDARTGLTRLTTVATSRASAEQRAGRAGRTEPGVAYRLWSKLDHGTRSAHRSPEILQADLSGLALELSAWGGAQAIDSLDFIDRPPPGALAQATELLTELGALDEFGMVTALGARMTGIPVHPRLARMIALDESALTCVLAALVDERDIVRGRDPVVDVALRVAAVVGGASIDGVDHRAARRVRDRAIDIGRRAGIGVDLGSVDPDRAGAALMLAYPDRVAARRRPGQFQLRSGSGAWIADNDPLAHEPFIVAVDLDGKRDRARVRLAAAVEAADVIILFGDEVNEQRTIEWDVERDELSEVIDRRLGAIRLGVTTRRPDPGEDVTAAIVNRVRSSKLNALRWNASTEALRRRVTFLHRNLGEPWPDWSNEALIAGVDEWLAPYLAGIASRAELDQLDLGVVLRSQLPWPQGADLDELAPPSLELPSGRSISIDYAGEEPTASVRVQDLFGVTEHPLAGRRPVRLELLSPADRPIQITTDLPGFWAGTWADVRKEMAGRYPKHQWPDDPANADPKRLKDRRRDQRDD